MSIHVYTITGQEVAAIAGGMVEPGQRSIYWMPVDRTGRALPPGVYLYQLRAELRSGVHKQMRKMVLLSK